MEGRRLVPNRSSAQKKTYATTNKDSEDYDVKLHEIESVLTSLRQQMEQTRHAVENSERQLNEMRIEMKRTDKSSKPKSVSRRDDNPSAASQVIHVRHRSVEETLQGVPKERSFTIDGTSSAPPDLKAATDGEQDEVAKGRWKKKKKKTSKSVKANVPATKEGDNVSPPETHTVSPRNPVVAIGRERQPSIGENRSWSAWQPKARSPPSGGEEHDRSESFQQQILRYLATIEEKIKEQEHFCKEQEQRQEQHLVTLFAQLERKLISNQERLEKERQTQRISVLESNLKETKDHLLDTLVLNAKKADLLIKKEKRIQELEKLLLKERERQGKQFTGSNSDNDKQIKRTGSPLIELRRLRGGEMSKSDPELNSHSAPSTPTTPYPPSSSPVLDRESPSDEKNVRQFLSPGRPRRRSISLKTMENMPDDEASSDDEDGAAHVTASHEEPRVLIRRRSSSVDAVDVPDSIKCLPQGDKSTDDLEASRTKQLIANKRGNKKALAMLGVDPSREKIMRVLGIDMPSELQTDFVVTAKKKQRFAFGQKDKNNKQGGIIPGIKKKGRKEDGFGTAVSEGH